MLSQIHAALLVATTMVALAGADFTPREDTIRGEVYDASTKVAVTVTATDTTPVIQREHLVDVTYGTNPPKVGDKGTFSLPTKFIPGRDEIKVQSMTREETRRVQVAIPNPRLNVRLEWAGNDHDYDLYVNTVNWTSTNGEGGKLDKDSYAGSDSGKGLENILFEQANPGIYKVYVNYYSDHGKPGADPTTVTITLGSETIFKETFTINEHEGHGADLSGGGKSVWNVATVVVHGTDTASGAGKAAAFRVVDGQWNSARIGFRDMYTDTAVRQNGQVGVFPRTNYSISNFNGPNGTGRVSIAKGQSVQFYASGLVNSEGAPQSRAILGKFQSSDTSVGVIDELGVMTGIKKGITYISATGGSGAIEVSVGDLLQIRRKGQSAWSEDQAVIAAGGQATNPHIAEVQVMTGNSSLPIIISMSGGQGFSTASYWWWNGEKSKNATLRIGSQTLVAGDGKSITVQPNTGTIACELTSGNRIGPIKIVASVGALVADSVTANCQEPSIEVVTPGDPKLFVWNQATVRMTFFGEPLGGHEFLVYCKRLTEYDGTVVVAVLGNTQSTTIPLTDFIYFGQDDTGYQSGVTDVNGIGNWAFSPRLGGLSDVEYEAADLSVASDK